jgi:tetratricopeptide (TPR) repeat protein
LIISYLELAEKRGALAYGSSEMLAAAYERHGQFDKARATLEAVVASDPKDIRPLLELARIAEKQKDFKGSLGYLAHARDLKPDYAPIHFFFGVACIEIDLPLEAKKSLQKAVDLDPENPSYNYARGSVELQGKSAWLAIPYFQKFVRIEPANPRGHFALGVAEFSSQNYELAAKELKLVAANPETSAGAEFFLGRIAKADGEWEQAAQHFEKSIGVAPNYADSHAELGLAKMHLGDVAGAKSELDRALSLNPQSYLANSNLLTLYQRTKNPGIEAQQKRLQELDSSRSEKQELMVRTIQTRP